MLIPILTAGPCTVNEVLDPICIANGSGIVVFGYPVGKFGYSVFKYRPAHPELTTVSLDDPLIQISVALKCEKFGDG